MNGIGGPGNKLVQRNHLETVEFSHQLFGLLQVAGGDVFAVLVGKSDTIFLSALVESHGMGHECFDQAGVYPVVTGLHQFQMVGKDSGNAIAEVLKHLRGKAVFYGRKEQQVVIRGGDDYIFDFRILFSNGKGQGREAEQEQAA